MLFNPLETFKSFSYDFNLGEYLASSKSGLIEQSFLFDNAFINNNFFYFPETDGSFINLCFLITAGILIAYFNIIKQWQSFFFVVGWVLVLQTGIYLFGIQTFVYTNVIVPNLLTVSDSINVIIEPISVNFAIFSVLFIKETISFISLFLIWYIFSNYSYSDTLLIPRTLIESIDELFYRKNLELFSDTLDLKNNEEVQNYQEFFIKMHGILLFILIANVQGMVPFSSTITSSLMNTFYVALAVFINILITLFREKGVAHFFSLFLPSGCPFSLIFLLNPIEFISYSFRLISLSVRLFANMMAGHTLMKVIAGFSWSLILAGDHYVLVHYVPFVVLFLLTFLEIAVGFIQTYIFVVLVYIYLTDIFVGH